MIPQRLLFGYFRSSAAYRVRIGLNLKGLAVQHLPVHLLHDGGQQHSSDYRARNPQGLVPLLVEEGAPDQPTAADADAPGSAWSLSQSLAILEYLDDCQPQPPLLPAEPRARARVRQLALAVACDIHPLNNLRVLQYLQHTLGCDEAARNAWSQHWLRLGLDALEAELRAQPSGGRFCVGDTPTLADCCLIPQLFNARRAGLDVAAWPRLAAIDAHCQSLPAFAAAHPMRQPDAPPA